MKEVIYTAIFVGLGIVLVILLLFMFLPKKQKGDAEPTMQYTAGVIVDENRIQSISLVSLDETVATMYPLMEPALENVSEQVIKQQSTEGITYHTDNQYTSIVLLNAIENALAKAEIAEGEAD